MKEQERGLVGQAWKMADLVDYQEGSVVSRQVLKGDGGNVTLFAFDEGEGPDRAYVARSTRWSSSSTARRRSPSPAPVAPARGRHDTDAGERAARPQGAVALQDAARHDQVLTATRRMPMTDRAPIDSVCQGECRGAKPL